MKLEIKSCGGPQEYAQSWVLLNKNFYTSRINERINMLQNKQRDLSDPFTWLIRYSHLTGYENKYMDCNVYLLADRKMFKDNQPVHMPIAGMLKQALVDNGWYAGQLVQNIIKRIPNIESIGFFRLDDYPLLLAIS